MSVADAEVVRMTWRRRTLFNFRLAGVRSLGAPRRCPCPLV